MSLASNAEGGCMEFQLSWTLLAFVGLSFLAAGGWLSWRLRGGRRRSRMQTDTAMAPRVPAAPVRESAASEALDIRPLFREDAYRFSVSWRALQARFGQDPRGAVAEADRLLGEVLYARGFPIGAIEEHAAAISADFPRLVTNYRVARSLALRQARGQAQADDLRQAFNAQRALFQDILPATELAHTDRRPS
jgi:hypothetical protein